VCETPAPSTTTEQETQSTTINVIGAVSGPAPLDNTIPFVFLGVAIGLLLILWM
jgi:hypothetical protein